MNAEPSTINSDPQSTVLKRDWRAVIRQMERECAAAWLVSARFWREQAKKHYENGRDDLAAAALLHAVVRETYAAEYLVKAGVESSEKLRVESGDGSAGAALDGALRQQCPTGN